MTKINEENMTDLITFRVDNDQGEMVDKTEKVSWVKNYIKEDFECVTGKKIGPFTISLQTSLESGYLNEIVVQNKLGQRMIYHYGGFDGYEVVEPWDHNDWFKVSEQAQ